ncbi:MAG TPA: hypothetical protein DD719_03010 [Desulfotomaculum sp.]|nr:hypothetical protein [Desulfotomaculum sp.]
MFKEVFSIVAGAITTIVVGGLLAFFVFYNLYEGQAPLIISGFIAFLSSLGGGFVAAKFDDLNEALIKGILSGLMTGLVILIAIPAFTGLALSEVETLIILIALVFGGALGDFIG